MTTTIAAQVAFTVPPMSVGARSGLRRVLGSGWLTTGPECTAFEEELSLFLGQPHVVTVASCTQALELSLRALRLDPGAAVLTPSLTFCGAVGAIVHAGYRPVLVDVARDTLTPDEPAVAAAAARAGRPAAMVVCDLGGYPVDHVALAAAAGLPCRRIVVDAAHGPGGDVGRAAAATAPFATCLSFYATKNLPIGEGGAVATYDEELAGWLRRMRMHGMTADAWRRYLPGGSYHYEVTEIGHKANLTDLQAAIGRAQLLALPGWQACREHLMTRYDNALAAAGLTDRVRTPRRHPGHARHLYQVLLPRRDEVSERLREVGIGTSVHFVPVHRLSGYAAVLGAAEVASVPVTDEVAEQLLSLPLYPGLADSAVDLVVDRLAQLFALEPSGG